MKRWSQVVVCLVWGLSGAPLVKADIRTEVVRYRHGEMRLEGYLAYDEAIEGPRPGVLVVHEWWGLNQYAKQRARQLADLGYVAFALDMYGSGRMTTDAQEAKQWSGRLRGKPILRQRAHAGLAVLASHNRVDPDRIAAIGYCFGGTVVLELAYSGADIKGAVSFHGSVPLPGADEIPMIRAKILICHGADDPFVPVERQIEYQQALHGFDVDWLWISYGGAVHSFTNRQAGNAGLDGVAHHPMAEQRSWDHMRQFLEQTLVLPGDTK